MSIKFYTVCKAVFPVPIGKFYTIYIFLHIQRLWWLWQISGVVFWKYYSHHTLAGPGHILVTPRTVTALSWAFEGENVWLNEETIKPYWTCFSKVTFPPLEAGLCNYLNGFRISRILIRNLIKFRQLRAKQSWLNTCIMMSQNLEFYYIN